MFLESILATIELCSGIVCLFALLYRLLIKKTKDRQSNILNGVLLCNILILTADFVTWLLNGVPGTAVHYAMLFLSLTFYTVDYVLLLLMLYYIGSFCQTTFYSKFLCRLSDILLTAELILAILSMRMGWLYAITPGNYLVRGPLFFISQIISVLMFALCLLMILGNVLTLKERIGQMVLYVIFPLIASLLQATGVIDVDLAVVDFGMILSTMMMLVFELDQDYRKRAAQQRMIDAQMNMIRNQQKEIADLRISAVISQIQPHFIFNVLNIIYYLCETDPAKAQQAVDQFSDYLRTNIDSLQTKDLVPFSQELKHVKNYISLEMLRYEDELTVQYDIETDEFYLPVLSVQPLVENAIKHGVAKSEVPGVVTIRTLEDDTHYYVYVVDNGVGFDPEEKKDDGRQHVGIENVRSRLEARCDGALDIFTQLGSGTTSVITIPKKHEGG